MSDSGDAPKPVAKEGSGLKSFLAGGFGGLCLVVVGHPLDLIKVKLQTGNEYKGIMDAATKTMRAEGPTGFYRGVSAPLVGITPIFAICFWGYDMGLKLVRRVNKRAPDEELSVAEKSVAGAFSAIPATVVMAPVERVKCLLQIQSDKIAPGQSAKYTGMADCAKKLLVSGGVRSLFRGWEATLLRDIPGSTAYFGVNAALKTKFAGPDGKVSTGGILAAGGIAGMANWAIAIPPDVLKSRLQTAPEGKYTGVIHVYKTLMKEEGANALFRGMGPAMVRAFPANAACFFGVDIATHALERMGLS